MSTPQAGPQQPLPLAPPPPPPSKMGRADPDLQHRIPPSLSARVKVAIFAASFAVKLIRAIKRFEPHIKNPERLVQYFAERHDDAAE